MNKNGSSAYLQQVLLLFKTYIHKLLFWQISKFPEVQKQNVEAVHN